MATRLQDIAERVGVSTSTVSLVLNGRDRGRVNSRSAAQIRKTADDMGYLPNMLARGLKTRHTRTIGVLAEGVASIPFSGAMLAGAQEAAWSEGYLLLTVDVGRHSEMGASAAKGLLQRDVDALILAADYPRFIQVPALPPQVPVIVLGALPEPMDAEGRRIDTVLPDDEGGAHQAVSALVRAGHRRIGFVNVDYPQYVSAEGERLAGYLRGLREGGLPVERALMANAPGPDTADGVAATEQLLDLPQPPTAIFCFSDRLAMAVYQVAARRGLRVPDDLSVVGFDDQDGVANALSPGLTTVRLPHQEMGTWAARRAIRRIRGESEPASSHRVECPLIVRGSVAVPH
jgi:LacI family transcriptional regulator